MAATEAPRSPVKTAVEPRRWWSATSSGGTSAPDGLPLVERSTRRVRKPASLRMSRRKRSSSPLVSSVPATITTGAPPAPSGRNGARGLVGSTSESWPAELVRAAASIRAAGTGCDQRVGTTGLDM